MADVYVVTEDLHIFNHKVANAITEIHSTPESAEDEIRTYFVKDGLIDGYKILSEDTQDGRHTTVMEKWFGAIKLVFEVKTYSIKESKHETH